MSVQWRRPAILAGWLMIAGIVIPDRAAGQGSALARSDVTMVFGYYGVSHGNSDRRLATAWGNTTFANGLGMHAEAHFMDREETAAFLAGGVSWTSEFAEMRGWLGTSTENAGILPELYARFEGALRTSAGTGLVFRPALTYRSFRNSAEEAAAEIEAAKYFPVGTGVFIFSALARATYTNPGDHVSASFGAGVTYAHPRSVSVGLNLEGGRASYDGLLAPGKLDERYFSVRPVVSFYLTENTELFGLMEYSSRESYDIFGGHLGLKVHFD